jgi:hypothetical protein
VKTYRNPKPIPTPAPDKSDTVKIPTPPIRKRRNPTPMTGILEPRPQVRKTRPGDTLEELRVRYLDYTGNSGKTKKTVPGGRVIGPAKKNPIKPRGAR